MRVLLALGSLILLTSTGLALPEVKTSEANNNLVLIPGTCGPDTHPAVPVGLVPGQGGSFALVHQFQGLDEGTVYVTYFMQTNTADNEWEDFSIAFAGYVTSSDGYEAGSGDTDQISGDCVVMGTMPTSRWNIDVLGGGGGTTSGSSCSTTTFWEADVHGDIGFGTGLNAGFTFSGGGSYTWGQSEECGISSHYDSGQLISGTQTITGPCLECIAQLSQLNVGFRTPSTAQAAVVVPVVDYEHCILSMVPVSNKMVDATGASWQIWQVYNPLDDTTPLVVVYENAPTADRFFGLSFASPGSSTWSGYGAGSHADGAQVGCIQIYGEPVFGYFDYAARAATGNGDCYSPHIGIASYGEEENSLETIKIVVEDHTGDSYWGDFGEDIDCDIDIYETEITMDVTGSAELCVACIIQDAT